MRDALRWAFRIVKLGLAVLAAIVILPLIGIGVKCVDLGSGSAPAAPPTMATSAGVPNYVRPEDQTYLTLPEWYIVYSADEYAAFVQHNKPSAFPFFGAIGQYWSSYYQVCAMTKSRYPFNTGYHFGLAVIGTSFTLEYIVKGLYENTIGRVSELLGGDQPTPEERYGAGVAKEYGDFIHTIPWYEFPFDAKLNGLAAAARNKGSGGVRRLERRFALSMEYAAKSLYGKAIKSGNAATYAPEDLTIRAWVEATPEMLSPGITFTKQLGNRSLIAAFTRYEAFTQRVPKFIQDGGRFIEIAGNDEILVTAIGPDPWPGALKQSEMLFNLPILTQPGRSRYVINAPVRRLHEALAEIAAAGLTLEHLYDY